MEAIAPDHLALQDWYVRENRDCINAMCARDGKRRLTSKSSTRKTLGSERVSLAGDQLQ
jgi:hypothetical protein